jgi:hypothetical protein
MVTKRGSRLCRQAPGWPGRRAALGPSRTVTDEQVEAVITKTLKSTPKGRDALVDAVDGRRGSN